MTAEQALASHGFTWERLEKLARRALHDRMRGRPGAGPIVLDETRYTEALELYVEAGAQWALRYDVEFARGVSFASSCYRRMFKRLDDYLRKNHGDQRRGTPLFQVPTDPTTLPLAGEHIESSSFDDEVEGLASTLPARAQWTLKNLGQPIAEDDVSLAEAAARAGVTVEHAEELLEELGWRLGRTCLSAADHGSDAKEEFELMEAWTA